MSVAARRAARAAGPSASGATSGAGTRAARSRSGGAQPKIPLR